MNSKQTDDSQEKKQQVQDWMPTPVGGNTKFPKQTDGNREEVLNEFLRKDVFDDSNVTGKDSKETVDSVDTKDTISAEISKKTEQREPEESTIPVASKRISGKQRKESLEEYRQVFLSVPKLEDRKPVFVSCEVRDRLDEIVRRLGGRKMSVSGFIENLALHDLESYREDFEVWKKL
jgi:hypothetical protein